MPTKVTVKNGNIESAIREFGRKSSDTRTKYREHEFYESRNKRRKRKKEEAKKNSRKNKRDN